MQEGLRDLVVRILADAQELLSVSDLSSGEPCCKLEGELACLQDLIESGAVEVRLTGQPILALGGEAPTVPMLERLRDRWRSPRSPLASTSHS